MIEVVQEMFHNGKLKLNLNELLICLIPKGEVSDSIGQFQPISICNMLVNVVSKFW